MVQTMGRRTQTEDHPEDAEEDQTVQHWCNCKLYVKYAWYEFRAMMEGQGE